MHAVADRSHRWVMLSLLPPALCGLAWSQDAASRNVKDGPGYAGRVRAALKDEQPDLIEKREHCSADREALAKIGRAAGQQVRIYRGDADFAVFTVAENRDEKPETIVRMGRQGRDRLGTAEEFAARVVATVPHPSLTEARAKELGECVERLDDDGHHTGLLLIAPHGGDVELHTDQQAERVAAKLAGKPVSAWRCKGFDPPGAATAFRRWHITSTDISDASYPLLGKVAARKFAYAVSFHGMDEEGILIGGGAPIELKHEVQAALLADLEKYGVKVAIARASNSLGGSNPKNIVNRVCKVTGIQIEQSGKVRRDHWRVVADAIARVYAAKL